MMRPRLDHSKRAPPKRGQPKESLDTGLIRIRNTARMRLGIVASLLVVALVQIGLPGSGEPFVAIMRILLPIVLCAAIAAVGVLFIARRDERRLREAYDWRRWR